MNSNHYHNLLCTARRPILIRSDVVGLDRYWTANTVLAEVVCRELKPTRTCRSGARPLNYSLVCLDSPSLSGWRLQLMSGMWQDHTSAAVDQGHSARAQLEVKTRED